MRLVAPRRSARRHDRHGHLRACVIAKRAKLRHQLRIARDDARTQPRQAGTLRQRMEGEQPLETAAHRITRGQRADRRLAEIDVGVAFVGEHGEIISVGEREQVRANSPRSHTRLRDWRASRCKPRPCAPEPISAATHNREGNPVAAVAGTNTGSAPLANIAAA